MRLKIRGTFQKASGFFQTKKFLSKKFLFIFFAVAIIATVGVSVPVHSADAGVWDKITNIGGSLKNFMDTFSEEGAFNTLTRMLYAGIVVVLRLVLAIVAYLAYFGAWLIDIMLSPGLAQGVLESNAIDTGWKTVRDMCNTFFIFFMLLIAFSTILRIQKYGSTKSLLSKFIISIFLINFSMVIAKIIIDVGQVFMYEIKAWMGMGFGDCSGSLTSIVEKFKTETAAGWQASFEDIIKALFAIIYTIMLGLIFIMLALFLLFRLVAFAILIVLSPFAFLSIVLPSMSKYTSEWFDTLVKYSIFGPIFLFFIYLSATMANELVLVDYTVTGVPAASADMSAISGIIGVIVSHSVALVMLWAVIPVTQRLGVAGSQQLIGGAMGMGKIAIGTYGVTKLAGGLGKKAVGAAEKRSSVARGVTSSMGKVRDSGLKAVGAKRTVLKNTAKKERAKEEHMKKVEMDFGDKMSIDLKMLEEKARSRDGTTDDKALWLKTAAAQSKLGENKETAKDFITGAEHSLSDKEMSEITDKNLTLATQTKGSQSRINNKDYESFNEEAQGRLKKKETTFEQEIRREKVAGLAKDGKVHQLQGLEKAEDAEAFVKGQTSEELKSNTRRLSKDEQIGFAKGIGKSIKKDVKDPKKGVGDMDMMVAKIKIDGDLSGTLDMGNSLDFNSASSVTKQLGTDDIAKLNKESFEYVSETASISQIKNLLKAGKNNIVDEMKECLEKKAVGANIYKPKSTVNDVKDRIKNIDGQIES